MISFQVNSTLAAHLDWKQQMTHLNTWYIKCVKLYIIMRYEVVLSSLVFLYTSRALAIAHFIRWVGQLYNPDVKSTHCAVCISHRAWILFLANMWYTTYCQPKVICISYIFYPYTPKFEDLEKRARRKQQDRKRASVAPRGVEIFEHIISY